MLPDESKKSGNGLTFKTRVILLLTPSFSMLLFPNVSVDVIESFTYPSL